MFENDSLKDFDYNWNNRDWTTVIYFVSIALLGKGYESSPFPVFSEFILSNRLLQLFLEPEWALLATY